MVLLPGLDQEYLDEIEAIAAGARSAGYDYDALDIITENGYFELSDYYLPSIGITYEDETSPRGRISPPMRCSSFVATDWTDGNVVFNTTLGRLHYGPGWKVILDIDPSSKLTADANRPGFIHSGTDFNVNSAGIVIAETTIANCRSDVNGIPSSSARARQHSTRTRSTTLSIS
jgi:hypothetical protein